MLWSYLIFTVGKDGNTRIFNTITHNLVRNVLSPCPKLLHETYSEIPSIQVIDGCRMICGINNQLMHFSI